MDLKYTKATDAKHKIKLESQLIYAAWRTGYAPAGQATGVEVLTSFVGNGAKIKIKGKSGSGKSFGNLSGVITNNKFVGEVTVPDSIKVGDMVAFDVDLSANGLSGESNWVPAVPPIEVTNMKWSAAEARRGDTLTLTADVKGVQDGTDVKVVIYEYDADSVHDKIAELPAVVKNKKIELKWAYEYHEDTDEIPSDEELKRYGKSYNPPEYFYIVDINGQKFGKKQDSGLLMYKSWIAFELLDATGRGIPDEEYIVYFPDGSERKGRLDSDGRAEERDVPPGPTTVIFPKID